MKLNLSIFVNTVSRVDNDILDKDLFLFIDFGCVISFNFDIFIYDNIKQKKKEKITKVNFQVNSGGANSSGCQVNLNLHSFSPICN